MTIKNTDEVSSSSDEVWAITRTFQKGAVFTGNQYSFPWEVTNKVKPVEFDRARFNAKLVAPIQQLLGSQTSATHPISRLYVCICGDQSSNYCEELRNCNGVDETPSLIALRSAFASTSNAGAPLMWNSIPIIPLVITKDWGLNAGSVTPLNDCIDMAVSEKVKKVLMWSPEIALTEPMVTEMLTHMNNQTLSLVGYLRRSWFQNLPWMFTQNTCAIWDVEFLEKNALTSQNGKKDYFAPICNGDGTQVDYLGKDGQPVKANLAGMEEFHTYLRALQNAKSKHPAATTPWGLVRWGMVGWKTPVTWNQSLLSPAEKAESDVKIARQKAVMDAWSKSIFPAIEPDEIYAGMLADGEFK